MNADHVEITTPEQADRVVADLLDHFEPQKATQAQSATARRTFLAAVLTLRPPAPLPDEQRSQIDALLAWENAARPRTRATDLPRVSADGVGAQLSLWQGDITTLEIDAIVNAANNQMLGCFVPGHRCIDNVIHAVAGPSLRAECAAHMDAQGHLEPTGSAVLTGAYHLPATYVVHTVGPIVRGGRPTAAHAEALASSYRSCLDVVRRRADVSSIAFCSISTGVFGYPIESATSVAIDSVTGWLEANPDTPMHVVFNTFSDHDTAVYRSVTESRFS